MIEGERTKIIATIGPKTTSEEKIRELISEGVDLFRLNFSYGDAEYHRRIIRRIKKIRGEMDAPIPILQDLNGPKIRIGELPEEGIMLHPEEEVVLNSDAEKAEPGEIPVSHERFADDVRPGHHLLLADGSIELQINRVEPPRVYCKVLVEGHLVSNKGINYPSGSFTVPAVTEKDIADLKLGLKEGVDFVALSYVRKPEDILPVREVCEKKGAKVPVIAKIEKHEALENLEGILEVVDGVIVARGDLGVEIPIEKIPALQKRIIRVANLFGKPAIVATQMLSSMVENPRPTRAEVTDIANAVLDGADSLLLSDETAVGEYPVKSIQTMARLARETEESYPFKREFPEREIPTTIENPMAIARSAVHLAEAFRAKLILCPTTTGFTARLISRFRPEAPIFALTPDPAVYFQLNLLWGVVPGHMADTQDFERLLRISLETARDSGLIEEGDNYIITAGFPFGLGLRTNTIRAGKFTGS